MIGQTKNYTIVDPQILSASGDPIRDALGLSIGLTQMDSTLLSVEQTLMFID